MKIKKEKKPIKKTKVKKVKKRSPIIVFPMKILDPVKKFLLREEKELKTRKKKLKQEDPFSDSGRTRDNAAIDAEAVEQFGHERASAMQREVERKLIQVRKALARIKIGRYGICEQCNKMIDTDRLMVMPEATVCVKCERKKED